MRRVQVMAGVASLLTGAAVLAPASAATKTQTTLLVNDSNAVGTLMDEVLSLKEAISLANGTLSTSDLNRAERSQVRGGTPGRHSRDLIRITLRRGTVISSPATDRESSAVGKIVENTGDTLDGGGTMLAGDGATGVGLIVASSDFTLKNIGIRAFNEGLLVDFGGLKLKNIMINRVEVRPGAFHAFVVGARSSNGHLKGVTITDSIFDAGAAVANAATITGSHVFLGGVTTNTVVEDVLFARNEVIGGLEGFYVQGVVANGGTADRAYARNIRVLNNYFHDSRDAAMNIDGASGILGHLTDSGVDGVEMAGNRISAESWGIGLWGGEAFGGNVVQRAYARNINIHHNQVTGVGSGTNCIILEGGRVDATGVVTDSDITNVRITNNTVKNCTATGIALHGAVTIGGGVVTTSGIRNVLISNNTVTNALTGIVARGAFAGAASVLTDSDVTGVQVLNNTINGGLTGMQFIGGEAGLPGSLVTGNHLTSVQVRGNTIRGAATTCVASADAGVGAAGNTSTVRCPAS